MTDRLGVTCALLAVLLSGCGAPPEPARATGAQNVSSAGGGGAPSSGGPTAPRACPPRYGSGAIDCASPTPGSAVPGPCVYPEGTCACGVPHWCGGMAPPERPPTWICEAPRPPCPPVGTPCSPGAAGRTLDPCGFDSIRCVGGVWQAVVGPRPP